MTDIAANARRVLERIAEAAQRAGRKPESVLLVAVSKAKSPEEIQAAVRGGVRAVGENYVQEARGKIAALGHVASWHLVGHLQRNKARQAAALFDLIHTLDALPLARQLDRIGKERGAAVRALVEVNLAGESAKSGVAPGELPSLLDSLAELEGLRVEGLMAIPPQPQHPEDSRPYFRALRELGERLSGRTPPNVELRELSMGMSDDFEVAIAEGATIVRVGRAIFGPRPEA